jgi:hypothetical protein
MTDVEALWKFIPERERARLEKIAEITGLSRSGALALKMMSDTLNEYCSPAERSKVLTTLLAAEANKAL